MMKENVSRRNLRNINEIGMNIPIKIHRMLMNYMRSGKIPQIQIQGLKIKKFKFEIMVKLLHTIEMEMCLLSQIQVMNSSLATPQNKAKNISGDNTENISIDNINFI